VLAQLKLERRLSGRRSHLEKNMTAKLCLHCGAKPVSLETLAKVPTPECTRSWHPLPHADFVDGVVNTLRAQGLEVIGQQHGLSHEGARYFGLIEVGTTEASIDYARIVGLRNSHDKRFPAGICAGSSVFVCDNLAFSGEVQVFRKHTRFIERNLWSLIRDAVGKLGGMWKRQDVRINNYKQKVIGDLLVHDLLIKALDLQILSGSKIPKVLNEWRHPRHPEFEGRTLWSWFNSVTEVLKETNIQDIPVRTRHLFGLCDQVVGPVINV
jgi:hypothetical protein